MMEHEEEFTPPTVEESVALHELHKHSVIRPMADPPHIRNKTVTVRTRIVIVREDRFRWAWSVQHDRAYGGGWRTVKRGKSWFRWTAWYDARMLIERGPGRMERWEAEIAVECQQVGVTHKAEPIPSKHFDG